MRAVASFVVLLALLSACSAFSTLNPPVYGCYNTAIHVIDCDVPFESCKEPEIWTEVPDTIETHHREACDEADHLEPHVGEETGCYNMETHLIDCSKNSPAECNDEEVFQENASLKQCEDGH